MITNKRIKELEELAEERIEDYYDGHETSGLAIQELLKERKQLVTIISYIEKLEDGNIYYRSMHKAFEKWKKEEIPQ